MKDTIEGHRSEPCISCAPHHVPLLLAEPITTMWTQGQGHNGFNMFEPCVLHPLGICFTPKTIFIKVWSAVHLSETVCRTYFSTKVKLKIECNEFYPCSSCLLSISFISATNFIKLWSNVHHNEIVCRTHNSTMLTQGQCHS